MILARGALLLAVCFAFAGAPAFGQAEGAGAAEPPVATPDTPTDPAEIFAQALESEGSLSWTRAIDAEVQRDTSTESRPAWVVPVILRFLTPPESTESPERTAFLWSADPKVNPLWISKLGQELLDTLLSDATASDRTMKQAGRVLARLVANDEQFARYAEALRRTRSASFFRRAFPILADYRPNRVVDIAISRMADPGGLDPEVLQETLSSYLAPLGLGVKTPEEWAEFWKAEQFQPIGRRLHDAAIANQEKQRLEVWKSAAQRMAESDALRAWLIDGLAPERLSSIRIEAIRRIGDYALKLRGSGSADEAARRRLQAQLAPLLRGALVLAADRKERLALRELALKAIGEMRIFRDDDAVLALLRSTLEELPGAIAGSPEYALGLEAIRVVGALGAALGPELDAVLENELSKAGEGWARVDREIVQRVLGALKNTDMPYEMLPQLLTVFEASDDPATKERVLQIFRDIDLGQFPEGGKQDILAFYGRLLDQDRAGPFVEKAIAGIDYLRLEEGVELLQQLASDSQVKEADRLRATEAIRAIGGSAALEALSQVALAAEDPVRARALALAIEVCADDPGKTLEPLYQFVVVDGSTEPPSSRPWIIEVVNDPAAQALLQKEKSFWVFETGTAPSTTFERWWKIEWAALDSQIAAAPEAAELVDERALYARARARATRDLLAVKGPADGFPAAAFQRLQLLSTRRAKALTGLIDADFAATQEAVTELAESAESYEQTVDWLLVRLARLEVRPGEAALLDAISAIGKDRGFGLPETTAAKLTELRNTRKVPESPKKPDGAGGVAPLRADGVGANRR